MKTLISAKSKRNPWEAPMWLVEHPFWFFQLGTLALSMLFFALTPLLTWMLFFAFFTLILMGFGLVSGVVDFFYEGGWNKIKNWISAKYDNYEKVED